MWSEYFLNLRNTKFLTHGFTSLPFNPILSQFNSIHTFTPYFSEININIILPHETSSSKWWRLSKFCDQNFVYEFYEQNFIYSSYFPCPLYTSSSSYPSFFNWTIEVLGFDSWRGLGIFLFTIAPRTAVGPTQPPIQWVPGVLFLGEKRLVRESDHSPPCSAEVKEWAEL
jgi:hypothetical protein